MFDSKISLRAMANTAAVRFASAAERCYRLERAGKATFEDFNEGRNAENENPLDAEGNENEMSLHARTAVLGGIWSILSSQCLDAGDNKYDAPMTLEDAYSLVVFGAVTSKQDRATKSRSYLDALIKRAVDEARESDKDAIAHGELTTEESEYGLSTIAAQVTAEFNQRFSDFTAVLGYINSVPVEDHGYDTDAERLTWLLNKFSAEERDSWYERALDKLKEAKEKLIERLYSTRIPAKAKSDMRAELPLVRADIQYLEQLCH